MAIQVKDIIADGFLALCKEKPLETITIKQILEKTGVSRQTFYNHFVDKNDLIQYIYVSRIIPDFDTQEKEIHFKESLIKSLHKMKEYQFFLKQACMQQDQNCLRDFLMEHCKNFDLTWHKKLYGEKPMPEALVFATKYHAEASTSMTLSWILSDMTTSCEEMAELITRLRSTGMEELFQDGDYKKNPYR